VPGTGIVDYGAVARKYAELIAAGGGIVRTGVRVLQIRQMPDGEQALETSAGVVRARVVVNCGGLHSDRIARLTVGPASLPAGEKPDARIVPFRGEYYKLVPSSAHLVKGLIYPVPDPRFPFLGVHFTRTIGGKGVGGGVEAGPNAVLALKREGYGKFSFSLRDTLETLAFPGFWRLAARHWRTGMGEVYRSLSKAAFVRALQKLVPDIRAADLEAGGAGVRAQALLPDGSLLDDFRILHEGHAIHVLNAPSPAATASLCIGDFVADEIQNS
jgi:L-2-hydroxyglutarate oxidase LhgO